MSAEMNGIKTICIVFLQPEDRVGFEITKSQMYAAKVSKKSNKPKRIRMFNENEGSQGGHRTSIMQ